MAPYQVSSLLLPCCLRVHAKQQSKPLPLFLTATKCTNQSYFPFTNTTPYQEYQTLLKTGGMSPYNDFIKMTNGYCALPRTTSSE
ncbi:hypothetical protein M0802_000756 [Mischocyttarus mexicanus]|nr:hypothetical protein M0802_000756 [Mischocyttarus mexicanus]